MSPRLVGCAVACAAVLAASACKGASSPRAGPEVSAVDVHRFADAWRQLSPGDSMCAPFGAYLRGASRGLDLYRRKFGLDQRNLCAAVRRSPGRYAALAPKLAPLDSITGTVRTLFTKLASLTPASSQPSVYFVVGNGIAAGTTTRGSNPVILIGMELNRSLDGLEWTIAHEMAHTQQHYPFIGAMTGGPTFLRGTLVRHSIMEGSADFIAELLVGRPKHNAWAETHESKLWPEFERDMHERSYERWLYNGANVAARGDRPPDLGYWIGYRIAKAYYERASDKRTAIREILSIRDFDAFYRASGVRPPLQSSSPIARATIQQQY